jgi:hypothetical protein
MMRLVLIAAMLVAVVSACVEEPAKGNLFSADADCAEAQSCYSDFCKATGNATSSNPATCWSNETTCAALIDGFAEMFKCLISAAKDGACQTDDGNDFAGLAAGLAANTDAAGYGESDVGQSCKLSTCGILMSMSHNCDFDDAEAGDYGKVCMFTAPDTVETTESNDDDNGSSSGAASVSTAVLAVLATVALLL